MPKLHKVAREVTQDELTFRKRMMDARGCKGVEA
jgi:hypothetical protein